MALSSNQKIQHMEDFKYATRDCVAGALHIYNGALLNSDASGNVKLSTDTASELFAGVSVEEVDQDSSASAGDNTAKVIAKGSGRAVRMKLTGVTKASIGAKAYASADDEVQLAADATNDIEVGTIVALDTVANYCFVLI